MLSSLSVKGKDPRDKLSGSTSQPNSQKLINQINTEKSSLFNSKELLLMESTFNSQEEMLKDSDLPPNSEESTSNKW